jgi:signal peptidase II
VTSESRSTPRSTLAIIAMVVVVLLGIAADLGTKEWAIDHLSGERLFPQTVEICQPTPSGYLTMDRVRRAPYVIVEGFFELRYAENCGAAFGFMNRWSPAVKQLVFFPVALGAVLVLTFLFVRGRGGRFLAVAVPLIIGGAIGNLVDRIRFGYVVDFIRFYGESPAWLARAIGPVWEYPTFNIADVGITVGVVLLLIDGWLEGRREQREAKALALRQRAEAAASEAPPAEDAPEPQALGGSEEPS